MIRIVRRYHNPRPPMEYEPKFHWDRPDPDTWNDTDPVFQQVNEDGKRVLYQFANILRQRHIDLGYDGQDILYQFKQTYPDKSPNTSVPHMWIQLATWNQLNEKIELPFENITAHEQRVLDMLLGLPTDYQLPLKPQPDMEGTSRAVWEPNHAYGYTTIKFTQRGAFDPTTNWGNTVRLDARGDTVLNVYWTCCGNRVPHPGCWIDMVERDDVDDDTDVVRPVFYQALPWDYNFYTQSLETPDNVWGPTVKGTAFYQNLKRYARLDQSIQQHRKDLQQYKMSEIMVQLRQGQPLPMDLVQHLKAILTEEHEYNRIHQVSRKGIPIHTDSPVIWNTWITHTLFRLPTVLSTTQPSNLIKEMREAEEAKRRAKIATDRRKELEREQKELKRQEQELRREANMELERMEREQQQEAERLRLAEVEAQRLLDQAKEAKQAQERAALEEAARLRLEEVEAQRLLEQQRLDEEERLMEEAALAEMARLEAEELEQQRLLEMARRLEEEEKKRAAKEKEDVKRLLGAPPKVQLEQDVQLDIVNRMKECGTRMFALADALMEQNRISNLNSQKAQIQQCMEDMITIAKEIDVFNWLTRFDNWGTLVSQKGVVDIPVDYNRLQLVGTVFIGIKFMRALALVLQLNPNDTSTFVSIWYQVKNWYQFIIKDPDDDKLNAELDKDDMADERAWFILPESLTDGGFGEKNIDDIVNLAWEKLQKWRGSKKRLFPFIEYNTRTRNIYDELFTDLKKWQREWNTLVDYVSRKNLNFNQLIGLGENQKKPHFEEIKFYEQRMTYDSGPYKDWTPITWLIALLTNRTGRLNQIITSKNVFEKSYDIPDEDIVQILAPFGIKIGLFKKVAGDTQLTLGWVKDTQAGKYFTHVNVDDNLQSNKSQETLRVVGKLYANFLTLLYIVLLPTDFVDRKGNEKIMETTQTQTKVGKTIYTIRVTPTQPIVNKYEKVFKNAAREILRQDQEAITEHPIPDVSALIPVMETIERQPSYRMGVNQELDIEAIQSHILPVVRQEIDQHWDRIIDLDLRWEPFLTRMGLNSDALDHSESFLNPQHIHTEADWIRYMHCMSRVATFIQSLETTEMDDQLLDECIDLCPKW